MFEVPYCLLPDGPFVPKGTFAAGQPGASGLEKVLFEKDMMMFSKEIKRKIAKTPATVCWVNVL